MCAQNEQEDAFVIQKMYVQNKQEAAFYFIVNKYYTHKIFLTQFL